MKYQHEADVFFLWNLTARGGLGGLGGFERHYTTSIFKVCLQKNRYPEKVSILQLLKNRTLTVF